MKQIIEGVRYDTDKATLVASDDYWDGSNRSRHGRNTYLYKSPRGRWFVLHVTQWQGERDRIEAVDEDRALELYEELPENEVEFEDAFGRAPEEA